MVILTDKEDDRRYYLCINRPRCSGRIAVDEALGYIWGEERPVSMGAGGTWQQTGSSSQSGAGAAVRRLEEGKLWLRLVFKRSKRKDKVPIDEVRGEDGGREIHEPKLAPYLPQRPKEQKKQGFSEVKETIKPRPPAVPRTADGKPRRRVKKASPGREDGWGYDWDDEIPAPKVVADKPRPTASEAVQEGPNH